MQAYSFRFNFIFVTVIIFVKMVLRSECWRSRRVRISNIAAASAFLADGWSTESVSRVVRTARTRQENHEKERAEHAYFSHIHDEVTISVISPATVQGLDAEKHNTRR